MAAARQKILIVDDDSNIAELISLYLMKECYETKIVGDGEAAIAAVETFEPDLILLDLMLPGMDGYQVCREGFLPVSHDPCLVEFFHQIETDELCNIGIVVDDQYFLSGSSHG